MEYVYDAAGAPATFINAAGCRTEFTDSRALPGGGTETLLTTYHYDLRGLQTKTDSPDGSKSEVLL